MKQMKTTKEGMRLMRTSLLIGMLTEPGLRGYIEAQEPGLDPSDPTLRRQLSTWASEEIDRRIPVPS